MEIKIVTDSTTYLPRDYRVRYDIKVVSLGLSFGIDVCKEEEIDSREFYEILQYSPQLPVSSPPLITDIVEVFEDCVKEGHSVVGVFISSDMSETYSRAAIAKKIVLEKYQHAKIELIDSRSNCMQAGFVALGAAQAAKEGLVIEEVIKRAESTIRKSRFVFCPEVLDYLKKGGRIGRASALLGSILQIKPILTVNQGQTDVLDKVRTKERAVKRIMGIFLEDIQGRELEKVIVHHINNEEEGLDLAKNIQKHTGHNVEVIPVGPVIGLHVGPGTIGLAYHIK